MVRWMMVLARSMAMDEATWERHANPLSVFSRFAVLPMLALAIWSRVWIGPWSLGFVTLVVVFAFLNPRLFPPPRTMDGWPQRVVIGERRFMAGDASAAERLIGALLSLMTLGFLGMMFRGLWVLELRDVVTGVAGAMAAKLVFVARMARLA